jgi:hypothetical protein
MSSNLEIFRIKFIHAATFEELTPAPGFWSGTGLNDAREDVMTEYAGIFAYHESAVFFEYLNFAFMSVYGLAVVCIVALSNPGKSSPFPPSLANPD